MKDTGERIIINNKPQNEAEYLIQLIHLFSYKTATTFTNDKTVLDFGCGSGYGAEIISPYCKSYKGVDISKESIEYAKCNYKKTNVEFIPIKDIKNEKLPFNDETFDVILSFQVIEHIKQPYKYIAESNRVLKKGGILLIITPNRETRLFPFQKPWNIYHIIEFSSSTLLKYLSKHFNKNDINIQGIVAKDGIVDFELNRTQLLKWLTLPATLKIFPEWWRINILKLYKKINTKKHTLIKKYYFTQHDIFIDSISKKTIDLFAIVKK